MNYLIFGLGNPGKKYKNTRHNIGFSIVEECARIWGGSKFTESNQAEALTAKTHLAGKAVLLVKPQTYMNESGQAVRSLSDYFDVSSGNILVVHDDVDLGLGRLQFVHDRSAGGHRGVRSVIEKLETTEFIRLRIGISPTNEKGEVEKQTVPGKGVNPFVMGKFDQSERTMLKKEVYEPAVHGAECWIKEGLEAAMNATN